MKKLSLFCVLVVLLTNLIYSQDIIGKLGGTTSSETFDLNDSNNNLLFRLQGDGNVGIGTTSPLAKLSVGGIGNGGASIYGETTLSYAVMGWATGTSTNWGGFFKAEGNTGTGIYAEAASTSGVNYGVYGQTNSTDGWAGYFQGRGYFSGNVGIGTPNPTEILDVNGNIKVSGTVDGIDIYNDVTANSAKVTDDDKGVSEVYGAGWNSDTDSPTKNDVYDKIQSFSSGTDDQKIDVFSISGNNVQLSIEADGETTKTVDISTTTAVAANTAKVTDDDKGVVEVYGAGWNSDTDSPTKNDVYDKIESLPSSSDNLGNHTATQDINMAGYEVRLNGGWLSGDGNEEGVFVADNGQVGIGTSFPSSKLEVNGNLEVAGSIKATGVAGTGITDDSGSLGIWVQDGGDVGIGTYTPDYKLYIKGSKSYPIMGIENTYSDAEGYGDGLLIKLEYNNPGTDNNFIVFTNRLWNSIGSITGNGTGGINYNTTSDARLKNDLGNVQNALGVVSEIKVRKYEFKIAPGIENIGFFAQELQKVYPDAVSGSPESDVNEDPMMIDYSRLTPILVKAIQELQSRVVELENMMGG